MTPRSTAHRAGTCLAVVTALLVLATAGGAYASGPDGRVRGYVTDSVSGSPIVGASVVIEAGDLPWTFAASTDVAGHFDVAVPPHRYTLTVAEPAHQRRSTAIAVGSGDTSWANVTLSPAGARSARLLGYVTDSISGFPVTPGTVAMEPPWYETGGYANTSATNATGYFEMALVPATYELRAEAPGYSPYTDSYVSLWIGEVLWYNLTLDPNAVDAWINGTVRDVDTSAPIAGATVWGRVDGTPLPPVTADVNGSYALPTPSGSVELVADAPGYAPASTSAYVPPGGTNYRDIDLMPLAFAVRGYILDGVTGGPLAAVTVTVDPLFSSGYFDQAITDGTGYYDVAVPDDYFVVSARHPGYTAWSSVALFFSGNVVWANGTLWPIVSTVSGYLIDGLDGSRVPGLVVNAVDTRTSYGATTTADGSGFYTLSMPPSPAITVWVYGQGVYAGNVAYVATRPYETTWTNITLDRLDAQILVDVTNALTGLPINGASVSASWYYGADWGTTNATGEVVLDAPAGVHAYLTATASGYRMGADDLTTGVGPNAIYLSLYPDLPRDVRVRGYVNESPSGTPMWSVVVEATGYDTVREYDYTDSSGYYELWTVAAPQTVRASETGYAADEALVNPSPGEVLWVNLTLAPDSIAARVLAFTATPTTGIDETNPTALLATVNETSLESAWLSILMLHSTAGNIGTFLNLGRFRDADVSVARTGPDRYAVSSSWDTRTTVGRLTDGASSAWWPAYTAYGPFLGVVNGYWDNDTLVSATPASAVFDTRDGRLLYVVTGYGFFGPSDQPDSTFAPYALGIRVDLGTAAIAGVSLVTGPTFRMGTVSMAASPTVPSGQYGALLELQDSAGSYTQAAVLFQTAGDTVPPVAAAGPDLTVDEDTVVVFDGTASTDNVGVVSWTWTFVDGSPRVLTGATVSHTFATPGTNVVTLTVEDADGNLDTDTLTVVVRDVTDPTIAITAPGDGATVSGAVTVTVSATDNVGVVRVEFLVDGVSVGEDTAAPFERTIAAGSLSVGNHTIEAVAHDAAGNSASATRSVTVSTSPPGGGGPAASDLLLPVVLILLVASAGLVAAVLLLRRRRPRAPTPTHPATEASPARPRSG